MFKNTSVSLAFLVAGISVYALADNNSPYPTPTPTEPTPVATVAPTATPAAQPLVQVMIGQAGIFLADAKGMSIYTFDNDDEGVSSCYNGCAVNWPPVLVTQEVTAPFGATVRTDGAKQLTYKGAPVYLFIRDKVVGDTTGDGVGEVWHLVRP